MAKKKLYKYIVCITISLFPYIFLKLDGINVTLFDIGIIIMGLTYLYQVGSIKAKPKIYYIASWLFIIVAILPFYFYGYNADHIIGVLEFLFILFLLFPLITNMMSHSIYKKAIELTCIVWTLFVFGNLFLLTDLNMYNGGRFVGLYDKPLHMGLMSALMVPFLIYRLFDVNNLSSKAIFLASLLISLFFLLVSGSRASLVGLFVGLLLYSILKLNIFKNIVVLPLIIILLSTFYFSFMDSAGFERNALERVFITEGVGDRMQNFSNALPNNAGELLLGVGLNSSGDVIQKEGGDFRPHNFFLSMLKETGVIGSLSMLIIMLLSLGKGIFRLLRQYLKRKKNDNLIIVTFSAGLTLFVTEQFSTVTTHRGYWLIFALCFWLSYKKSWVLKI